jgi:hypothetical protein
MCFPFFAFVSSLKIIRISYGGEHNIIIYSYVCEREAEKSKHVILDPHGIDTSATKELLSQSRQSPERQTFSKTHVLQGGALQSLRQGLLQKLRPAEPWRTTRGNVGTSEEPEKQNGQPGSVERKCTARTFLRHAVVIC